MSAPGARESAASPHSRGDVVSQAQDEAPVSVLVVEDSQVVRDRLLRLIRKRPEKLTVKTAGSGAVARRQFDQSRAEVVLLDLSLPDEKGFDLLAAFKSNRPDCRVIVLTNHAYPEFRAHATELGACGFYNKAIEFEAAVEEVGREAQRHAANGKEPD